MLGQTNVSALGLLRVLHKLHGYKAPGGNKNLRCCPNFLGHRAHFSRTSQGTPEVHGTQLLGPADGSLVLEHPVKHLKLRGHLPWGLVLKATRHPGLPPRE